MIVAENLAPGAAPARKALHLRVLSPSRAAFDGEALSVTLPAFDGEWGVLPNHAPTVAELAIGCLRLTKPDGTDEAFAVRGGFAEIRDNTVTVLSPDCRGPGDLTPELIEAEMGKASEADDPSDEPGAKARRQAWAKACRGAHDRMPRKPEPQ